MKVFLYVLIINMYKMTQGKYSACIIINKMRQFGNGIFGPVKGKGKVSGERATCETNSGL